MTGIRRLRFAALAVTIRMNVRRKVSLLLVLAFALVAPAQCGPVRTGSCPAGTHVENSGMNSFTCVPDPPPAGPAPE